jgi:hypothetical protein
MEVLKWMPSVIQLKEYCDEYKSAIKPVKKLELTHHTTGLLPVVSGSRCIA